MNKELLKTLSYITEEEQELLNGHRSIDPTLYYDPEAKEKQNTIDSRRVLSNGRIIDIRPHTRFVHFPPHSHNYIEVVYMAQGSTTHYIDQQKIILEEGDLLFMNQHAIQEILPASRDDIAVNFMILPHFFDSSYANVSSTTLRDFLISCLTESNMGGNYLYFRSRNILPVQNIMETLIWLMLKNPEQKQVLAQQSIQLLFSLLANLTEHIETPRTSYDQDIVIRLLNYIETQYDSATLAAFSSELHIDIYTLSRLIKRNIGATFKELLIAKRMKQAAYMLKNTTLTIQEIANAIGYENASYFYRLFEKTFHCSPRQYRLQQ